MAEARTRNTTDLPEGFKTTELGPLPEGWQVVRLGEVYVIQQGKLSTGHEMGHPLRPT